MARHVIAKYIAISFLFRTVTLKNKSRIKLLQSIG